MREYVIVTDSCCDFPPKLVQDLGVTVIPLSVQLGKDRFHNTPEEAPDSHVFYTRLSQGNQPRPPPPMWRSSRTASVPSCRQGRTCSTWAFPPA